MKDISNEPVTIDNLKTFLKELPDTLEYGSDKEIQHIYDSLKSIPNIDMYHIYVYYKKAKDNISEINAKHTRTNVLQYGLEAFLPMYEIGASKVRKKIIQKLRVVAPVLLLLVLLSSCAKKQTYYCKCYSTIYGDDYGSTYGTKKDSQNWCDKMRASDDSSMHTTSYTCTLDENL
jgi:hypothetical protein